MGTRHREAFEHEMNQARALELEGRLDEAFRHLERAHVLGQRYVVPHTRVHGRMLVHGWRRRDLPAAWGQAVRLVLGAIGSAVGRVPVGNTGGSDISMFQQLPIEADLAERMRE